MDNYPPIYISVISVIAKTMEKLVHNQLYSGTPERGGRRGGASPPCPLVRGAWGAKVPL